MGSFADLSQVINTLTGGAAASEQVFWFQDNRVGAAAPTAPIIGQYSSLWTYNKFSGSGVYPGGTARTCTSATVGAIPIVNPSGGREKYLLGAGFSTTVAGAYIFHDRIRDISGLNATTTTAQTLTGVSDTRYSGAGVQAWVEIYTIIGTTATTLTISYTNQAGTSGRTSKAVVIGGTGRREVTRAIPIPLQDGDTGVRSVQSVTVLATTGTAGDFGIVLKKPLVLAVVGSSNVGTMVDLTSQLPSLPKSVTNICMAVDFFAGVATAPSMFGMFSAAEA
jgi:hypothetical protein